MFFEDWAACHYIVVYIRQWVSRLRQEEEEI